MPETAAGRAPNFGMIRWTTDLGPSEFVAAMEQARALGRAEALAKFKDVAREITAQLRRRYDDQWATGPVYLSDVDALDDLLAAIDNLETP